MNITTKLQIDLQKKTFQPEIDAVQGDTYSRCLELSLYAGSLPWNIPENTLIAVRYAKEDHTYGYYDTMPDGTQAWSIQGNVLTIQLAPQMLTVPGIVMTQVELICKKTLLSTFSLKIRVEKNPAARILRSETYINWLQWMEEKLCEHVQTIIDSGDFTGPQGPTGPAAEVLDHMAEYQTGDSGTTVPTGIWSPTIPHVPQGKYLWLRNTQTYNNGKTVSSYTVSRFGVDGTGSVSSVAGLSPDTDGNISLTALDIHALPITGGNMRGSINMSDHILHGLTVPTENTEATNKGYVDNFANSRRVRNLLDNSDFLNPVVQTSVGGSHGTHVYAIDRWLLTDGSVSISENIGMILNGTIRQNLEFIPSSNATAFVGIASGSASITYSDRSVIITSSGCILKWAALYEGDYTTETMPAYVSKGYSAELMECQRYFYRMHIPAVLTSTNYDWLAGGYVFPVPMRAVPTQHNLFIAELSSAESNIAAENTTVFLNKFGISSVNDPSSIFTASQYFFKADFSADIL